MSERALGYWVMVATGDGRLQHYGHPDTPGRAFVAENDALAHAARIASESATDSVYVMTVFDNGTLAMAPISGPDCDPRRLSANLEDWVTRW